MRKLQKVSVVLVLIAIATDIFYQLRNGFSIGKTVLLGVFVLYLFFTYFDLSKDNTDREDDKEENE